MYFTKEILEKASAKGSTYASDALSKLSGSTAKSDVSNVEIITLADTAERIKQPTGQDVVVYGQVLIGVPGVAFLIIKHTEALALVDLLNHRTVGTTTILNDIGRSAIKETLNILSNSYLNALAEESSMKLGLGVPNMITAERLDDIITTGLKKTDHDPTDNVAIFESVLTITDYKISASLYLIFNDTLPKEVAKT